MSVLTVENLTHGFGARRILEDASFRLLKGERVGLIGANGEGKSTFLQIITGQLPPDRGRIAWSNRVTVGYLDQHAQLTAGKTVREVLREAFQPMFDLEAELLALYNKMADVTDTALEQLLVEVGEIQDSLENSGFYTLDVTIEEVAGGLGLTAIGLDRDVADLSGGQRSKVLLTKLLLTKPTILLLDEPTNYLDVEHIEWLKRFLLNYPHAFILISHDLEFLDAVVNVIYHVENAILTRYSGNYAQFQQLYAVKKSQEQAAYERQQQEVERLEDFIARNKARVATRGMANSRQKRLDKLEIIDKPREKPKPTFGFKEARTPGRFIVQAQGVVLGYEQALTKPLDLTIERGQKIAVRGMNGLGKSTLLKTLLGKITPLAGRVVQGDYVVPGYFEQEALENHHKTAIDEIWDCYPGLTNFEVRAALARCGLTNEHITSKMMVLSGGENAKVRLCKLMLQEVNWLILDEPTNHLDIEAKAELKRALESFKGTILLVSHELEFYQDWVSIVWDASNWQ